MQPAPEVSRNPQAVPLVVDLDGTLIRSDVLVEGFLRLLKKNVLFALAALWWLRRGRAYLKACIAARTSLDPATLPYDAPFVAWLREQRAAGRSLVLCTAANHVIAEDVARHLGLFDQVLASSDAINLSGRRKAELLEERFGRGGFDYAGNEVADLAVWKSAHAAVVVNPTFGLRRVVARVERVERQFVTPSRPLHSWLRALRLHQWAKNALLFVPAAVSHKIGDPDTLLHAALGFLCFGVCASGNYVLNDLLDLDADRVHPRKQRRPFAAGELPLVQGLLCTVLLIAAGIATALLTLPLAFAGTLGLYLAGTFWYSWMLKRIAMVDVLALSGLYTVRVIAGGAAISVTPSFWLLAFSMFMFLSLALVKRYTELRAAQAAGRLAASGRGYTTDDLALLLSCGISSAFLSVLVLALYVNEGSELLYRRPEALWLICPLMLYWVCRVWRKTHRGELHDDPVVFAIRDRPSLIVAALCAALAVIAT